MIDWGIAIAAMALLVTMGGGFAAWAVRFGKTENSSETARIALQKAEAIERELADFRVEVARSYATAEMVAAVDQSVTAAINRLADRIDRILETRPLPRRRTTTE